MGCYVLGFQEIDQTQVAVVGGKSANLGELARIEGLRVPAGFCVTTDAFRPYTGDDGERHVLQTLQVAETLETLEQDGKGQGGRGQVTDQDMWDSSHSSIGCGRR